MVFVYAKELQGNKDKYVMQFVAEIVKESIYQNFITLEDLYIKKESDFINIFQKHFVFWKKFNSAKKVISTNEAPHQFYVSVQSKKRNVIPLVKENEHKCIRITEVSKKAKEIYNELDYYQDALYGYVEEIVKI